LGFLRRSRTEPAPAAPIAPPAVDLAAAAPVVDALSRSMGGGTDAAVRGAILDLLAASGTQTDPDRRMKELVRDPSSIHRPWRWLAEVATKANAAGEHQIAAHAFVFTHAFTTHLAPRMAMADHLELGLDPVPAEQQVELVRAGLAAGNALAPDVVVAGGSTDSVTGEGLLLMVAHDITSLEGRGLTVVA